ncbi:MAG: radical SAM protein [Oligoflexia bacterium]|nr:radical SAM protein [Oligoflexia bacterium]
MFASNNVFSYFSTVLRLLSFSKVPADLVYFVTSDCNCNCKNCLFQESLNKTDRRSLQLSLEEVDKIAKRYGKNLVKLSLSGGEPFLRSDILEILGSFVTHTNVKIIDIPTNGSRPNVIADKVKCFVTTYQNVILEIQLSVDGTREIHEKIRGFPGLFELTLQTYQELDAVRKDHRNLKIKMNTLYQPDNIENIRELYELMLKNNCIFDRMQIVFPHGAHIQEETLDILNYDKFYELSQSILKSYPIYNKKDFHSLLFRAIKIERDNVLKKTIKNKNMGKICKAGKRNMVLDDIGTVYPCEPIWEPIGNIRDYGYSMEKICNSEAFKKFKQSKWGNQKCNCTWGNIALDEVVHNPKYYPKILFNLIKLLVNK